MKKAFVVASVASMIDQFNKPIIKLLKKLGYIVVVGCNFEKGNSCTNIQIDSLKEELESLNVKYYQIDFDRNMMNLKDHIIALRQIKNILKVEEFDLIHCQSPMGGLLTRAAAKKYRKKGTEVIYTAHGYHFYKGAPLKNWILFYPLEKYFSRFTDKLITINTDDFSFANKKMKAKKVYYVKGVGVETNYFSSYNLLLEDKNKLLSEIGIDDTSKVILSVGELNENKNHKVVIKAIKELNRDDIHYVIAGKGKTKEYLTRLAEENNVNLHLIGFRDDLVKWYKLCDLFVLPSYREGLAVSLLEAIASNANIIATDIRGNRDVLDKEVLFKPNDYMKLASLIERKLNNIERNVSEFDFDISNIMNDMESVYLDNSR